MGVLTWVLVPQVKLLAYCREPLSKGRRETERGEERQREEWGRGERASLPSVRRSDSKGCATAFCDKSEERQLLFFVFSNFYIHLRILTTPLEHPFTF